MPISGSQPALMEARSGIARSGATRSGYFAPRVFVVIGGTDRSEFVQDGTLAIHQALNDEPDTARFTILPPVAGATGTPTLAEVWGTGTRDETSWVAGSWGTLTGGVTISTFVPLLMQSVSIGVGSIKRREFGGQILAATHRILLGVEPPFIDVTCYDWGRRFDRRKVTKRWTNTSATDIARDIIDNYTAGFTQRALVPDLPTLEFFQAANEKPSALLRRLAGLIGGAFYIDPHRDVHLFGEAGEQRGLTDPRQMTDALTSLLQFRRERDSSQVRTRVIVEGEGAKVLAALEAGATLIPIETADPFNPLGGTVSVEQQVVFYTGLLDGGGGSLVGPGVAPPTQLVASPQAGAGVEAGVHDYAFTWVTASGETLPSPLRAATIGPLSAPASVPNRTPASGEELGVGTYTYATTFVAGGGETTPGPTGAVATTGGISGPAHGPSIVNSGGGRNTTGVYAIGDTIQYRVAYVNAETGLEKENGSSGDSNVIVVADVGGDPAAINIGNIPFPSDPRVALKRIYRRVNGVLTGGFTIEYWETAFLDVIGSQGGYPLSGGDTGLRRVQLTNIPLGGSGTTARKIYRTAVNGSQLRLVATINDNSTTSHLDAVADVFLGANVPTSNTTVLGIVALSSIAVGPSGTTQRKVYRTVAGGSQLKLQQTIANNTATAGTTDSTPDASLGANAPLSDTSGLTQSTGQVNTGASTIPVAGPGAFPEAGWAILGSQAVRYTGKTDTSLTGVPTSGPGSLGATVNYGSTIAAAPQLTGIPSGGDGSLTHGITKGATVHLRVTRDDTLAQAIVAAAEGDGDGVHEHIVIDHSLSENGAIARALSELAAFKTTLVEAEWETTDLNARPGRTQAIALAGSDPVNEALMIVQADVIFEAPNAAPYILPRRRCMASSVKRAQTIDVIERARD